MDRKDQEIIEAFAKGDQLLRDEAIRAYRRAIPTDGVHGTLHQNFMSEVDSPCPDYGLRVMYRQKLLDWLKLRENPSE